MARRQLSDEVQERIVQEIIMSGVVPTGELLPTESELGRQFGVSRITVRAALRGLREAGLITTRQGKGSQVLPAAHSLRSHLDRLCSFETFAEASGRSIDSGHVTIELMTVDGELAGKFELADGAEVTVVRRTKVVGGRPIGWIVDYVPTTVVAEEEIRRRFQGSVLDILLDRADLRVAHAECVLGAVGLPADVAQLLEVPVGAPALFIDESTINIRGQVINISHAWLLSDHFALSVRRQRKQW